MYQECFRGLANWKCLLWSNTRAILIFHCEYFGVTSIRSLTLTAPNDLAGRVQSWDTSRLGELYETNLNLATRIMTRRQPYFTQEVLLCVKQQQGEILFQWPESLSFSLNQKVNITLRPNTFKMNQIKKKKPKQNLCKRI